ncbi:MAG: class II aldolase/adducin family protein [Emcibacter sp.]|nr:class II aldolase/adducin family protein [Emcibacter sp.]
MDLCNEREMQLRIDLAAAYRLIALFNWDDLIFTHISARVPGPEHHFLINPYGLMFDEITASSLVKVSLDGKKIDDSGQLVNPAGFTIHSAVHGAREDAQCVIHLHTIDGVAVSCQKEGLLSLNQTSMILNGQISYHEYEGLALNHEERARLVTDLGSKNVMILRNHGTLSLGRTIAEAFTTIYFLERSCSVQVAAQAGGVLHIPDEGVQKTVARQVEGLKEDVSIQLVWPALKRKLDRLNPGYEL